MRCPGLRRPPGKRKDINESGFCYGRPRSKRGRGRTTSPNPVPRSGKNVLLVDDERDILDSLQDLLESSLPDLHCKLASSGAEALAILKAPDAGIDLILSDYKMPGMNGLQFLEQARAVAPQTPRLLMTAFPDLEVAIEAINEARVEVFLTKPLDPDKVIDVVRDALQAKAVGRWLK